MFSPSAAAIFCFSSISSTVEIRSRRPAASSKRVSSEARCMRARKSRARVLVASFQEQPHVANRGGVGFVGG